MMIARLQTHAGLPGRNELARARTYERVYGSQAARSLLAYIQHEFDGTPVAAQAAAQAKRIQPPDRG